MVWYGGIRAVVWYPHLHLHLRSVLGLESSVLGLGLSVLRLGSSEAPGPLTRLVGYGQGCPDPG